MPGIYTLNSAKLIVLRQLFRPDFCGSSVRCNEQRGSSVKFPHTLFRTQTLTESRHITCPREGKSPSTTSMMCHKRKYRMDKTNLRNMGKTIREQHIGSIKDLRPPKIGNKLTFKLHRTANEYAARGTRGAVLKLTDT